MRSAAVAVLLAFSSCDDSTRRPGEGAAPDAANLDQACETCDPGQMCAHFFDGTCNYLGTECVTSELDCAGICSDPCEQALCGAQYSCQYPCVESEDAIVCNGP
jgi:hypothetical protein